MGTSAGVMSIQSRGGGGGGGGGVKNKETKGTQLFDFRPGGVLPSDTFFPMLFFLTCRFSLPHFLSILKRTHACHSRVVSHNPSPAISKLLYPFPQMMRVQRSWRHRNSKIRVIWGSMEWRWNEPHQCEIYMDFPRACLP